MGSTNNNRHIMSSKWLPNSKFATPFGSKIVEPLIFGLSDMNKKKLWLFLPLCYFAQKFDAKLGYFEHPQKR